DLLDGGDVSAVEGAHGARDRAEVTSFPQLSGPKRRRDQRREVVGGGGPAGGQHGAVGGRYRGERSDRCVHSAPGGGGGHGHPFRVVVPGAARHRCMPAYERHGRTVSSRRVKSAGAVGRPSVAAPCRNATSPVSRTSGAASTRIRT